MDIFLRSFCFSVLQWQDMTLQINRKRLRLKGVVGHQDSIIDGVLVDVKSASGMGFDKFKYNKLTEDDPFGYVAQVSAYAAANGLDRAAFLAINKSTGEVCLSTAQYGYDQC